jgi:hypothetical protein
VFKVLELKAHKERRVLKVVTETKAYQLDLLVLLPLLATLAVPPILHPRQVRLRLVTLL